MSVGACEAVANSLAGTLCSGFYLVEATSAEPT